MLPNCSTNWPTQQAAFGAAIESALGETHGATKYAAQQAALF
jgi:hypothetical protein